MSRTLDLLRLTPEAALRELIAEAVVPGISAKSFKLGVPVAVSGNDTAIRLELDKLNVPVDMWAYTGSVDFEYPRLDLGAEFSKFEPVAIVDFPTTTQSICASLTKRYGILFDTNDFVDETVSFDERGDFVLKCKPESLRWVGQYPLTIKQRIIPLNIAFNDRVLDFYDTPSLGNFTAMLVSAMNTVNQERLYRHIEAGEISISVPSAVNEFEFGKNTKVTVSVLNSDLYSGSADFFYTRHDLNALTINEPIVVRSFLFSEYWEAAQKAGEGLGITIRREDIVPGILPAPAPGQQVEVMIDIVDNAMNVTGPLHILFERGV